MIKKVLLFGFVCFIAFVGLGAIVLSAMKTSPTSQQRATSERTESVPVNIEEAQAELIEAIPPSSDKKLNAFIQHTQENVDELRNADVKEAKRKAEIAEMVKKMRMENDVKVGVWKQTQLDDERIEREKQLRAMPNQLSASATRNAPATQSGTHIGPRGGVFHYSENGKKVYQKH